MTIRTLVRAAAIFAATALATGLLTAVVLAQVVGQPPSLDILAASGVHHPDLELLVLEQTVAGGAGDTIPEGVGDLDGAGVIGYVFPTTLAPAEAGFGDVEGILAIAVTAHPDFDDTPLFDEDDDGDYANDGASWHSHWVVLVGDERVAGGLAVRSFEQGDPAVVMPPTNPGLPIYLDSPGYPVVVRGDAVRVLVPTGAIAGAAELRFDAVTAYMQVAAGADDLPLLGVHQVIDVLSGDLGLPYQVEEAVQ